MKNLIDKLQDTEIDYIKMFSEVVESDHTLTFTNSAIPDMYTHNFTLYKSKEGLVEYILNELDKEETKAKGFFRVETYHSVSETLLENLPIKPEICIYNFLYINTNKYNELNGNPECKILCADTKQVLDDGINVDIAVNTEGMGLDFAQRRINGQASVYRNNDKAVQLFVCYSGETAIGNIEYMQSQEIVKMEDFDILEAYQRKGFGTSVLKHLLEKAFHNNIEHAYLITESDNTAMEMYEKCGFEKVGEKTELLFFLKN
ncbi:GNAT family N-acetyltransferase [Anaerobacillus isosaccharinicus]|uniref:GNAT family N-acetyltransferase n=1 Tax=Anaerobacillus isosaccharinicus TaxID=1532552 RepID=A0A1S2KX68_9BACI|nr:GNAT family N-acetyltransferase [Anaerobacillus isosaccharinicus]MBA5586827.1 GNAT family N-acetyltransferase [Anaerobacillus isosaccharinicus]QOY34960.1 GNAT family N-acetyltransferase [Anaerobacillus isosaccharinicus]